MRSLSRKVFMLSVAARRLFDFLSLFYERLPLLGRMAFLLGGRRDDVVSTKRD
jgi:hypothetical protein